MSAHQLLRDRAERELDPRGFRSWRQLGAETTVMVPLLRGLRLALAEEQDEAARRTPIDRLLRDRRERIACDWAGTG